MELKTNTSKVMGINNLGNPNNFKYAEEILEDFTTTTEIKKNKVFQRENKSVTRIQLQYLKKIIRLAEANDVTEIDFYLAGTNRVLHMAMYNNSERIGTSVIAPLIDDKDKYKQERQEYQVLNML